MRRQALHEPAQSQLGPDTAEQLCAQPPPHPRTQLLPVLNMYTPLWPSSLLSPWYGAVGLNLPGRRKGASGEAAS